MHLIASGYSSLLCHFKILGNLKLTQEDALVSVPCCRRAPGLMGRRREKRGRESKERRGGREEEEEEGKRKGKGGEGGRGEGQEGEEVGVEEAVLSSSSKQSVCTHTGPSL